MAQEYDYYEAQRPIERPLKVKKQLQTGEIRLPKGKVKFKVFWHKERDFTASRAICTGLRPHKIAFCSPHPPMFQRENSPK